MANVYPSQERHIDPYASYYSDNVNKLTRIVTEGKNCILSHDAIEVVLDQTTPTSVVIMKKGSCVKDDVLITFLDDLTVDMKELDFYLSGNAFNEAGIYYLVVDFVYVRARPAPRASIKLIKPSQHSLLSSGSFLFIKGINVIFTGSVFEISALLDSDDSVVGAYREYTDTHATLANELPIFTSSEVGKLIYDRSVNIGYFANTEGWNEFGTFDYKCDTSLCTLYQLAYIGPGEVAHPALADSITHFASCFVTKVGTSDGRVRISGKISNGLVQSGITIFAGDSLYLSPTEAGKVTNIDPLSNSQIIGKCISVSGNTYTCILTALAGSSAGIVLHNLLSGIEGGGGGHYYHLTLGTYNDLTSFGGNHNNIPRGLQGGSSTERYHLTSAQASAVASFGGNHNNIPIGLQGGSVTERYHLNLSNYTALTAFGGNHNSCPTGLQGGSATERYHLTQSQYNNIGNGTHNGLSGLQGGSATERYHLTSSEYTNLVNNSSLGSLINPLKSYIISLLSYNSDTLILKDKDPYSSEQDNDNVPIGDIVNGETISNYGIGYDVFGTFGSFLGGNWTSISNMNDTRIRYGQLSLSNNIGMVAGGINGGGFILSIPEAYTLTTNVWSNRTAISVNRARAGVSGMTSTSDFGLIAGGTNTNGYTQQTDGYTYSTNAWDTKSNIGYNVCFAGSMSLTNNISVIAGGENGTGSYLSSTTSFSVSSNTWFNIASLSYAKSYPSGISLNSDNGLIVGGYNGSMLTNSEKLSLTYGTWTTRASLPVGLYGAAGISQHSNFGVVVGGSNGAVIPYLNITEQYNDSYNTFTIKDDCITPRDNIAGISFTNFIGIISGGTTIGTTWLSSAEKFTDSTVLTGLSEGKIFMTDSTEQTPEHHKASSYQLNTIRLTNNTTEINKIAISTIYKKQSTALKPTVNISLDDGVTWISGASTDSIIDTSSLSPNGSDYNLKLIFNVFSDSNADTWTARGSTQARAMAATFGLTNSTGLAAGGLNGTGILGTSQIYDDITGLWASTTDMITARTFIYGIELRKMTGIVAGGSISNIIEFFDGNSSTWYSTTNMSISRSDPGGFKLTDDIGIIAGGNNNYFMGDSEKFSKGKATWTTISSMSVSRDGPTGLMLTKDTGLAAGGNNGNPTSTGSTERYSDSMNIWISRSIMNVERDDTGGISLTSNYGLIIGGWSGNTGTNIVNNNEMYIDSGNLWTFRKVYPILASACGGISLTSNNGIISGGQNGVATYTGDTNRYNFGETSFVGFATLPLN